MRSIINRVILSLTLLASLSGLSLFAAPAAMAAAAPIPTSPKDQICAGVGAVTGDASSDCSATPGQPTVEKVLRLALNILSFVVGVIAVIMLVVGGLKYILSQGESAQTASAKNTILYAVIGMVVASLAQVIVKFVLNKTVQ